jgi:hypothetical protein
MYIPWGYLSNNNNHTNVYAFIYNNLKMITHTTMGLCYEKIFNSHSHINRIIAYLL